MTHADLAEHVIGHPNDVVVDADGRTLFLCSAPDFDEGARSAAREARLLSVRVDVPHGGRP